jgi:membrane-bound lytic murein transglycosylase F
MMLTLTTAKQVEVTNRLDPEQSIMGGARYIRQLVNAIPSRIQPPDNIWLALAAYNIGFGHLEDARIITQKQGADPDSWKAIKEHLPLLRTSKWYQQTRHGYARGNEAVRYVENIRSYYDILAWITDRERPQPVPPSRALEIANPVL